MFDNGWLVHVKATFKLNQLACLDAPSPPFDASLTKPTLFTSPSLVPVHPKLPGDVSFPGQKLDLPVEQVPASHPFKKYITEICPPGYHICSLKPFICKSSGELRCPAIRKQPASLLAKESDYITNGTPLSNLPDEVLKLVGPDRDDKEGSEPEGSEPEGSGCVCL